MHERLARLRQKLATTTDPDERADLEAAIAALAEKLGAPAPPANGPILVSNLTDVSGVAIGANARATVYIDGRQGKTNDELLAAYYQRLAYHCRSLPLQGVYEQRTTTDCLAIDLDQVYIRLATTEQVARETFNDSDLITIDWQAYLEQHLGDQLLPEAQRYEVQLIGLASKELPASRQSGDERRSLGLFSAQDLATFVRQAQEAVFFGPQLISEAIAATPRLVLLGEPGSGKSTALRYLAYTLARAGLDPLLLLAEHLPGWRHGRLLPIFVALLPLAQRFAQHPAQRGDAADLWAYVADNLQPNGANPGLAAAVYEELEAGRVILLLDGLDEVAGADSRRKVVRAVHAFAERYRSSRMVVACRVRAYTGERNRAWQLTGWPNATLADWTLGQMQAFVHAWYQTIAALHARHPAWGADRITSLTRAITTRDDLQRFGRQPLMLTVMALVHLNDGRLPEERASLYGRCIDILLGQWEVAGKDASAYGTLMDYIGLPDADAQSLRPLLARAAYEAHLAAAPGEVGRLSRPVLRTMVDDELKRRGHPNPSDGADMLLEYTDLRASLIQASDAGDAYVFPHQTFQEYLAGVELVSGVNPLAGILERRNDDRWRRPIMLGIEQLALSSLDVPFRLLSWLVDAPDRSPQQRAFDLLLAHELASDLGWAWLAQRDPLFTGLKARLAQAMASTLSETSVPARDLVQLGELLALLGDPREGVCTLPPPLVAFTGRSFVIGMTPAEMKRLPKANRDDFADTRNELPTVIVDFALARYPVTNAQYQVFIEAGGYNQQAEWWQADEVRQRWLTRSRSTTPYYWNDERFGISRPNHPAVGVSWYEAMAFCHWLTHHLTDGFVYCLPSEAEWEYTARGIERRTYPWGEQPPDAERANFNQAYHGTTAVGCFSSGATPEGVLDLAGNVWEWTRSEYRDYPYNPNDGRESGSDPAPKRFTLRGGAWGNLPISLRAAFRNHDSPGVYRSNIGFRLARHARKGV